ncbi:MAG TPA: FAD-dependent monooxygenase [Myxococcaceae bacterium]|nr:FAD-dependent monooxygenase [Myxococcaceae bacterium]
MDWKGDVVVVGAGTAGCAAAAALAELGLETLVVEPGMDRSRQLAGELMHPAGAADLRSLGFDGALRGAGAVAVTGFAVVDATDADHPATCILPYGPLGEGVALEHSTLVAALQASLAGRPRVTVWNGARVVGVPRNDAGGVEVDVVREDGAQVRLAARLLVAADGRASRVRGLLGIEEENVRLSSMSGTLVDAALLPHRGLGHLFVGGPAPVLAYAISPDRARVMVDLPTGSDPTTPAQRTEYLKALPPPLRDAVIASLASTRPLASANFTRLPRQVARASAVLVGDSAGCCHPLSASGMSSCTRDALALQRSLREAPGDVPGALARYALLRRGPQRTRLSLASALYRCFTEPSPEMAALRRGIVRYWTRSASGRAASMALLSTRESRMWVMSLEYARVVGYSLAGLARALVGRSLSPGTAARAAWGLVVSTLPHVRQALRGAVEDAGLRRALSARAEPLARAG